MMLRYRTPLLVLFAVPSPLSNMPGLAAAFSCKAGGPMVRETRAEIW
jgi:hypothetical protein